MQAYEGVEVHLYEFLTSALDGCEWSALCPGRFTTGERAPVLLAQTFLCNSQGYVSEMVANKVM
jgi:hypothetical protein